MAPTKPLRTLFCALALNLLAIAHVWATAGDLDLNFGNAGKVTTQFHRSRAPGQTMAVQADGKILALALYQESGASGDSPVVVRYLPTGELDTSFGLNGRVASQFTGDLSLSNGRIGGLALQSDGKIVVAGTDSGRVMVARYTNAGVLDASFGNGGRANTSVPGGVRGVALQSDGKILVGGIAGRKPLLVRVTSTGALDTTFNTTGVAENDLGSFDDTEFYGLTVQSDGKALLVGTTGLYGHIMLVRYTTAGALDHTFGGTGGGQGFTATFIEKLAIGYDVAVQSDGKIVVAALTTSADGLTSRLSVVRFTDRGLLDTTFNGTGVANTLAGGTGALGTSLALQSDGKIVAAGAVYHGDDSDADFAVARFTTTGALDTGFHSTGYLVTAPSTTTDIARKVVVQNDGNIVVVGSANDDRSFGSYYNLIDLAVARYTSTGAADTTFNGTGVVITPIFDAANRCESLALQNDGKILAAGYSSTNAGGVFAVARYTKAGALDPTFGTAGRTTAAVENAAFVTSMAVQNDGAIVLAGPSLPNSKAAISLARFTSAGVLDPSFGTEGVATTVVGDFGGSVGVDAACAGMVLQGDGKFVAAGTFLKNSSPVFGVVRYKSNGALDTAFGSSGKVTTTVGSLSDCKVNGLAVQGDGKIVVVGRSDDAMAVVRYKSNGALDTTFGGTGKVITPIGTGSQSALAVGLQPDGKIVVVGTRATNADVAVIFRYTSSGALDSTFNGTGMVVTNPAANFARAHAVAFQNDGKIVAVGTNSNFTNFVAARYTDAGVLDLSFSGTGTVMTPCDGPANAVAVQTDRRIVVGGTAAIGSRESAFRLVRYEPDPEVTVVTDLPTGVTANVGVLHGTINPNGQPSTEGVFEWGTSPSRLTNTTPAMSVGSGTSPVPVSATLTGLIKGTVYYYRLRGDHAPFASQFGEVQGFATTADNPPGVISQPASQLTATTATLNSMVNPNGHATSAHFEWGTTTGYGNVTTEVDLGSELTPSPLTAMLSGLTTDQVYHFRAVATSETGLTLGPDRTFTPSAGAPQPQDDVVLIDGASAIRVLDNDTDPNGDPLSLVGIDPEAAPASGTAQIVENLIYYTPGDGMLKDEFGYIVRDSTGKTAKARVRAYRLSEIRGPYFGVLGGAAGTGQLNIEISASGAFSLLLTWQGFDYALKGRLDSDRSFVSVLRRQGLEANALLLLRLQFDPLSRQVIAQLTDSVLGGPFTFEVPRGGDADAAVDAVAGQLYTTTIDIPDNAALPEGAAAASGFVDKFRGSGFASVKIAKNRSARFIGQMPDTAKFSAGSPVSRRTYAFYSALYRVKRSALGSVSGQASLQSNFELRSSSLTWQRGADDRDTIFNGAFNTPAFLNGDRYTPPSRGQLMQIGLELLSGSFSNAKARMTLGGLVPEFEQSLKFVPGNVRVVGENPYSIKLKISPKTGTFAGMFTHNATRTVTKYSGIFITSPFQIREGRGSFRGLGAGGKVRIAKP